MGDLRAPRAHKSGPRAAQERPREPQERPRGAQESPKSVQKRGREAPRRLLNAVLEAFKRDIEKTSVFSAIPHGVEVTGKPRKYRKIVKNLPRKGKKSIKNAKLRARMPK